MIEGPCWQCGVLVSVCHEFKSETVVVLNRMRVPYSRGYGPTAPWVRSGKPEGVPDIAFRDVEVTWAPRYRVHECVEVPAGSEGL